MNNINTAPHKMNVCILSAQNNLSMMLKELARSMNMNVVGTLRTTTEIIKCVTNNMIDVVIIDDEESLPSVSAIRQIYSYPSASLTHMLVFVNEAHKEEREILKNIPLTTTLDKPLTPTKFHQSVKTIQRQIESPTGKIIRKIKYEIINNNHETTVKMIQKVINLPSIANTITPTYANYFKKLNKPKSAESVLLNGLKYNSLNAGIIFSLTELYLEHSSPKLAVKLLEKAKFNYGHSKAILYDLAQAYMLLDRSDKCIMLLKKLIKDNYNTEECKISLAKLHFTRDEISSAKTTLAHNKNSFYKLKKSWAENIYTPPKTDSKIKQAS